MTKRSKKKFRIPLYFILITLTLLSSILSLGLAYDKIKLTKFPEFQRKIRHFVQDLPLAPKTPKYLLEKSIATHESVKRYEFEIQGTLDSEELANQLNLSSLDLTVSGQIDNTNPKSKKLVVQIASSDIFDLEIRKKSQITFLKADKLPSTFFSSFGFSEEQINPFLGQWISYQSPSSENGLQKVQNQKWLDQIAKILMCEPISLQECTKAKVEKIKKDNTKLYKLTLNPNAVTIDEVGRLLAEESQKNLPPIEGKPKANPESFLLSKIVKNLQIKILIDPKTYLTKSISITSDLSFDSDFELKNNSVAKLEITANLNEIKKPITIPVPKNPVSFEEFFMQMIEEFLSQEDEKN